MDARSNSTVAVILTLSLGLLSSSLALAESTISDTDPVIQLAPSQPPALSRHLGWRCSALLRSDFSRFNKPDCGEQASETTAARELQVNIANN